MIRKQIYLTPEIDGALEIAARQQGKAVARIVREILVKGLQLKSQPENPGMFLLDLAAIAGKGPKNLSQNMFSYLYGEKSRNYGRRKKTVHRR